MSTPDLVAGNGVTHVVDNVLGSIDPQTLRPSDVSINATAVHIASKVLDTDIFNEKEVHVSICFQTCTCSSSMSAFLHEKYGQKYV